MPRRYPKELFEIIDMDYDHRVYLIGKHTVANSNYAECVSYFTLDHEDALHGALNTHVPTYFEMSDILMKHSKLSLHVVSYKKWGKDGFQESTLFYDPFLKTPDVFLTEARPMDIEVLSDGTYTTTYLTNSIPFTKIRANLFVDNPLVLDLKTMNITKEFFEKYIGHSVIIESCFTSETTEKSFVTVTSVYSGEKEPSIDPICFRALTSNAIEQDGSNLQQTTYYTRYFEKNLLHDYAYTPKHKTYYDNPVTAVLFTDSTTMLMSYIKSHFTSKVKATMFILEREEYFNSFMVDAETIKWYSVSIPRNLGYDLLHKCIRVHNVVYVSGNGSGGILCRGPVRILYPATHYRDASNNLVEHTDKRLHYIFGVQIDTKDEKDQEIPKSGLLGWNHHMGALTFPVKDQTDYTPLDNLVWYSNIVYIPVEMRENQDPTVCGSVLLKTQADLKKICQRPVSIDDNQLYLPSYGVIQEYSVIKEYTEKRWPENF